MINKLRMSAAGAALAVMAMASAANAAETETATAEADVVLAFTLTNDTDLDFGAIVNAAGGGDVTVATDDSVSCGGSLVCHGTTTAAAFSIAGGTIGKNLYIDLPVTDNDPLTLGVTAITMVHDDKAALQLADPTLLDAAVEIELHSFTTSSDGSDANGDYVTIVDDGSGAGEASFSVGGTASLDGSEVEGRYSATFDVTVDYE